MKALCLGMLAVAIACAQDAPDVLPGQDPLPADQALPGDALPGAQPAGVVEIPPPAVAESPVGAVSGTTVTAAPPSPAAAQTLPPELAQPAPAADGTVVYTVQLGAFKSRERAFALYWEMSQQLSHLQVTAPSPNDQLYRVRCGTYPNYDEAKAAVEKLQERGIECFVAQIGGAQE
jgi:cell division septation protein DedD